MPYPVLIVGGGLAGLTTARLLHRAGIGFRLLEARSRLGGRILSADATGKGAADGFDLGPSWFWPGMQPGLAALVADLGLAAFPQRSAGDIVVQRMAREAPQRYRGTHQASPPSMRLAGGTGALVTALAAALPPDSIALGTRVTQVAREADGVAVRVAKTDGAQETLHTAQVVFALPPRLLAATVSFAPALDAATAERWRTVPTWMAPHAKFLALYDRPFWHDAGLSGTAQSMVGPLVEIHDATTASGRAALFGFLGVPAAQRAALGDAALSAACVAQLQQLFGPEAGRPRATLVKDWAADPLTATADDQRTGGHSVPDGRPWVGDDWRDWLVLAGSETSDSEPGYLAGAVDAAQRAAAAVIHARVEDMPRPDAVLVARSRCGAMR